MNTTLNINANAVIAFTNQLEQFNKTAFPVAVRNALNGAAFDVKQRTMPETAKDEFEQRDKNFFKATSKVIMARGLNVNSMKSEVGFTPTGRDHSNQAVDDLQEQEHGGTIQGRSFVPLSGAREGNTKTGRVKPQYRLSKIDKIINTRTQSGKTPREQFMQAAFAAGIGGFVLGNDYKGRAILWRINSLSSNLKKHGAGQGTDWLTALYSYKPGRAVKIKHKTNFMATASQRSALIIENIYIREAKRIFDK